ncbi:pyridoxal 5'-phosphate synthase glutaminase subunit PdxT, partial [Adlercreutzia sp. DFI.6.23]|nr:pyridoxal 5'-phosphate synthase glutaminase subunit PdxT [Adlercreutzia sp. DFI.6.23]
MRQRIAEGLPALGTCAGLILLADHFRTLPVTVRRNAYGR